MMKKAQLVLVILSVLSVLLLSSAGVLALGTRESLLRGR
jgi:hypothetical protein